MSIFSDNITNEIPFITKGKKWITSVIKDTIEDYDIHTDVNNVYPNLYSNENFYKKYADYQPGKLNSPDGKFRRRVLSPQQILDIQQQIIWRFISKPGREKLKQFNIDATHTVVTHSRDENGDRISDYDYDVIVNVRFIGDPDFDNYVNLVCVHFTLTDKKLVFN